MEAINQYFLTITVMLGVAAFLIIWAVLSSLAILAYRVICYRRISPVAAGVWLWR